GHPGERTRLPRDVAVQEELDRAKLELADVAFVQELLDVGALRRVAKFVGDHRRAPGLFGGAEHLPGLPCIEGERFLAEDVLACPERGDRERVVGAGWRD